ncbi:hypothetical protein [Nannocystis pusilla]|uniref:hypothetical protein n=1 Tax=Nannocystis pusilla TaxID=889268 RepID=UPI003BF24622
MAEHLPWRMGREVRDDRGTRPVTRVTAPARSITAPDKNFEKTVQQTYDGDFPPRCVVARVADELWGRQAAARSTARIAATVGPHSII